MREGMAKQCYFSSVIIFCSSLYLIHRKHFRSYSFLDLDPTL